MCTDLWWPVLFIHLHFMTYSAYEELFDVLYFIHISQCFMLKKKDKNSLWPCFSSSDFYGLFCLFTSWLAKLNMEWYFMASCAFTSGDLFCTHTSTWWPILYMRIIVTLWIIFFLFDELFFTYFMAYRFEDLFTYSVQLPPIYTYNPPFFTYFL